MVYLFNKLKPKSKAHLWTGDDTESLMWSSGGIKQNRKGWKLSLDLGTRDICHMCRKNSPILDIVQCEPNKTEILKRENIGFLQQVCK